MIRVGFSRRRAFDSATDVSLGWCIAEFGIKNTEYLMSDPDIMGGEPFEVGFKWYRLVLEVEPDENPVIYLPPMVGRSS